jgi:hypothetical protein
MLLVPVFLLLFSLGALADPLVLDYLYRYDHQPGVPDHVMSSIEVSGGRAIVCTNRGLSLIDLDNLPIGGEHDPIHQLTPLNARDIYDGGGGIYYVNLHRQGTAMSMGFAVVRLVGDELQLVDTYTEEGVLFEKMCVADGFLYVTAHRHGLRIYSLDNPELPVFESALELGFEDAFAVHVEGDIAYVADGPGGLKRVNISDANFPYHLDGEDLDTALGTAEEISYHDGDIYMALGGEGLGIYAGGNPAARSVFPLDGFAESLAWIGDYLAVGVTGGVVLLDLDPTIEVVASETAHRRGSSAELRLTSNITAASGERLLCANWDFLDVYQLKEFALGVQPDIQCDRQRIRFAPAGGSNTVTLSNAGAQTLVISSVSASPASFSTAFAGGSLEPGESVSFDVSYAGSPAPGEGTVLFYSNDPDESPLPIQVFGETDYLDPGEESINFTLPLFTVNPDTGEMEGEDFTLTDHLGKVVWFQVFGTW